MQYTDTMHMATQNSCVCVCVCVSEYAVHGYYAHGHAKRKLVSISCKASTFCTERTHSLQRGHILYLKRQLVRIIVQWAVTAIIDRLQCVCA